jgi:hypothetical protein
MTIEFNSIMEVDRTRPHAELDGTDVDARLSRYREQMVVPTLVTKHALTDEGSYFVTNNAQTGIATSATPTTFSATNPFILIYNASRPSDDFASRLYVDYVTLLATAAGTAGTSLQYAITKDVGNRFSSGGTEITANIANLGPTSLGTLTRAWAGNITATAASGNAKTLIGNRFLSGSIPVAGDEYTLRFGAAGVADTLNISTVKSVVKNMPPIVLGPDESLLVHIWLPAQSAASSYAPELGWWER